jgi:aspartate/methionine/tyrosine aminotransferase
MSKSFGLAGWRLGYLVYPLVLHPALRSLQDTIPTHAAIVSQVVGRAALEEGSEVGREVGREGGREGKRRATTKVTTATNKSIQVLHIPNSFSPSYT